MGSFRLDLSTALIFFNMFALISAGDSFEDWVKIFIAGYLSSLLSWPLNPPHLMSELTWLILVDGAVVVPSVAQIAHNNPFSVARSVVNARLMEDGTHKTTKFFCRWEILRWSWARRWGSILIIHLELIDGIETTWNVSETFTWKAIEGEVLDAVLEFSAQLFHDGEITKRTWHEKLTMNTKAFSFFTKGSSGSSSDFVVRPAPAMGLENVLKLQGNFSVWNFASNETKGRNFPHFLAILPDAGNFLQEKSRTGQISQQLG